ncbi:MAG: 2-hydroxychromene-2-carboxylate isomerase [Candidatus Binatota bacterium]|jgi:2-hydroxychromene-2-carboxylate isomerase|nr:2-hydroxychromene-2-carboxylate isomerase [Candidatus Binatota bacterium]
MPEQVDFFFDFVSPYTYLAETQLSALKTRTGATFRLWPMHLLNLMKRVGNSPTTVLCANKMKYAGADIGRWVSRYRVPFEFNPHVFAADQSLALRGALVAQDQDVEEAYNRAVFRAFWAEGVEVNDRARLAEALKAGGLDGNALLETADAARYGERLAENTETAAERGVFGSPTFIVGDDVFFGNDRLEFLEQRLQR